MFNHIDSNKNGRLSVKEVETYFLAMGIWSTHVIVTAFSKTDKDKTGDLDFNEFARNKFMKQLHKERKEIVKILTSHCCASDYSESE